MRPRSIGFKTRGGEIQFVHVSLPADGVEQRFAGNFLFALEIGADACFGSVFDAFHFFVEPQRDAPVAQVIAKRFHHFRIRELEQARPLFDERHAHAERRKHAGVLDADHAAADHDHRFRNDRHLQNLVAVDDGAVVEGNERRVRRLGSRRDDDVLGFVFGLVPRADNADVMRIDEAGHASEHFDAVARELRADHVDLGFDHVLRAKAEIRHRDLFLHAVVDAVDALVVETGKMQDGFADGLAGDRAGVDRRAADDFEFLDERHALAVLHGLNGRALSRGTGAEDDEVVTFHAHGLSSDDFDAKSRFAFKATHANKIMKIRGESISPMKLHPHHIAVTCDAWRRVARRRSRAPLGGPQRDAREKLRL